MCAGYRCDRLVPSERCRSRPLFGTLLASSNGRVGSVAERLLRGFPSLPLSGGNGRKRMSYVLLLLTTCSARRGRGAGAAAEPAELEHENRDSYAALSDAGGRPPLASAWHSSTVGFSIPKVIKSDKRRGPPFEGAGSSEDNACALEARFLPHFSTSPLFFLAYFTSFLGTIRKFQARQTIGGLYLF